MQPINAWSDTQFAPVPGLSEMLMQRNRDTQDALGNIGQFAGALGAGAIGAVQASGQPQVLAEGGQTPSTGMAALKGGLMNFNKAYTGTGDSFKQFAAMGKMADTTRSLLDAQTPRTPDQQPKVMGYTDDEWKHLGTADKVQAFQATKQAMDQKTAMLGYDTAMQHFAQIQQQMAEQKKAREADARFSAAYAQASSPKLNTGDNGFSMYANMATGNAVTPGQSPNGQQMLDMAIRSGMTPRAALDVARSGYEVAQAKANPLEKNVRFVKSPGGFNVAIGDGGQFQFEPAMPGSLVKPSRDPYAEMDYRTLAERENKITQQISEARGKKQFDLANQLVGELSGVRKQKESLRRNNSGTSAAPVSQSGAPYPEGTRLKGPGGKMFVVKNGQPVAE